MDVGNEQVCVVESQVNGACREVFNRRFWHCHTTRSYGQSRELLDSVNLPNITECCLLNCGISPKIKSQYYMLLGHVLKLAGPQMT